jgi:hypothetical protein
VLQIKQVTQTKIAAMDIPMKMAIPKSSSGPLELMNSSISEIQVRLKFRLEYLKRSKSLSAGRAETRLESEMTRDENFCQFIFGSPRFLVSRQFLRISMLRGRAFADTRL